MAKRHRVQASQRSVVARIEEIVLASSGADAFELVFSVIAARLSGSRGGRDAIARGLRDAAKKWPGLDASTSLDVPDTTLAEVCALLDRASLEGDAEALDAVFEQLVTRVGKGDKGQFFTPRHVVDWIVRLLLLSRGERVVDPACGSGAFLVHARANAKVETWGMDVDGRAVRVARLVSIVSGEDPARIVRGDSLRRDEGGPPQVDVVVTNPPFAGDVAYPGYAVAGGRGNGKRAKRVERDALFVERCVEMLRPGGRLAIVLPHNKVAARSWSGLRMWLVENARVLAVASLPRETFLPHTSQKAVVVFAKKRMKPTTFARLEKSERTFFAASERAGKDSAGEPIFRPGNDVRDEGASWRELDHDLDAIALPLANFLRVEGFTS
jgi:type I restriction enzyme M protein